MAWAAVSWDGCPQDGHLQTTGTHLPSWSCEVREVWEDLLKFVSTSPVRRSPRHALGTLGTLGKRLLQEDATSKDWQSLMVFIHSRDFSCFGRL